MSVRDVQEERINEDNGSHKNIGDIKNNKVSGVQERMERYHEARVRV